MISDLQRRMEYKQDVAGWKSIIFLPFQFVWQCIIIVSVIYVFVTSIMRAAYPALGSIQLPTTYFCDSLYFFDILGSILHHALPKVRKLRNFRPRTWIVIVIDTLSLLPLELFYVAIYSPLGKHSTNIWYCMYLNRTLRIYRIPYYFYQYENSVNSIRLGVHYGLLKFYLYLLFITQLAAAVYHKLISHEEWLLFKKNPVKNVFLEQANMYMVLSHRFIAERALYNTLYKRICFIVFMVIGFLYYHGHALPRIMFGFQKKHQTFFDFWNRLKRLRKFINNVIENEALEKKTLAHFQTIWTYGKGDNEPELLRTYPTNLRKNVYADMYWDVFKHSELLQNLSRSCKRSLALKMVGDFHMPNTIFWDLDESKSIIMYLASGILQIMAEENKESPIMSFSNGTVLGETSMFYPVKSKAILRVATFSEIHILQAKDFFHIIKDYPKDREKVLHNLKLRIKIAKITQVRRNEICKVLFSKSSRGMGSIAMENSDSVKWIKTQFRQIMEAEEMHSKFSKDHPGKSNAPLLNQYLSNLKTGIDHTSIYLPLLNLGEDIEVITDQTCLKTTIPWVIDPNSPFERHWRYLILVIITFTGLVYPLVIGWWDELPKWIISLSVIISIIYLCDIIIQVSTAIKEKNEFITKSGPIFRYRLKRLSFYADFIAALPYQLIFNYIWLKDVFGDSFMRLSIAISLMKIYRLISFLDEWCQTSKGRFSNRIMIKYIFYTLLSTYWVVAFFQLTDVECLYWSCEGRKWYNPDWEGQIPVYKDLASVFFAISYLLGISTEIEYSQTYPSTIFVIISLMLSQFILMSWFGQFTISYMSESAQKVEFKNLLQSINAFMSERGTIERTMKRIWDTLHFQWVYDWGDYLTQDRAMLEDAPLKLKAQVNGSTIFKMLKKCEAFQSERDSFIWTLCQKSSRLVLPSGSIIVNFGIQSMAMYAVYKGYLQVNTFLPKDIAGGIASSIMYGPGKIVPIVIGFNQMPSGVTARALTDCELIAIPLEELLSGLMIVRSFKDFVDAIKEVDLEPFRQSRLVFCGIEKEDHNKGPQYKEPFRKFRCCGWLLRCLLVGATINSTGKFYIRWESFRVLSIIIEAIFWPIVFTLPAAKQKRWLIYSLLGLETFTLIDFYIKMHLGYYNSKGIYISHPLSTSKHYITTSFLLELSFLLPFTHAIYFIVTYPHFRIPGDYVIIHCVIRILALYRVFLFALNYSESVSSSTIFRTIFFGLILLIGLNCFIVLKIWSEIERIDYNSDSTFTISFISESWIEAVGLGKINSLSEMYLVMFYCVVMLAYRGDPFYGGFTVMLLVTEVVMAITSVIFELLVVALILSFETGSKMNFIVYQYHMKNLTEFLREEEAEDKLSQEAINHFEYEWEKTRGDDLHVIFSRFPNILHEDLMYPVYRSTFFGVSCFKNANHGFFRTLSRVFIEVPFRKMSVISFEKAVHTDIFFVFKGQCRVKEQDVILVKGSVMGDIKGKGIMKNNIYADTHVVLLKIDSPLFFSILNTFPETERAFFEAANDFDDYVKSIYDVPDTVQSKADWMETAKRPEECEFEMETDEKEDPTVVLDKKKKRKKKIFHRYINPNSRQAKILAIIFMADAIVTAFIIPMIMALGLDNLPLIAVNHSLDIIWLVKIITTFRTAYVASDTGNLVTDTKSIFHHYLKSVDGLIIDVLCIVPLEHIFSSINSQYHFWNPTLEKYFYALRLLRLFSLWIRVKKEKKKLSLRNRTKWFIIIMRQLILYNLLSAMYLMIDSDDRFSYQSLQNIDWYSLMDVVVWSYLSMFSIFAGTGLRVLQPTNFTDITFRIVLIVYSLLERSMLASEALAILNSSLFVKSEKLYKMQLMERFLSARDVSPALRKNLMQYASDLLTHANGEANPWFLRTAPYYIRVEIARDLYLHHLENCYAFRKISKDFLKQMAARFQRYIFFPSDVITEKGDVDCCMYFVHHGEVVSIESDPIYRALDYETGQFGIGDFFGLESGIYRSIPQKTTYRALTKVDLLVLNYFEWKDLRLAFPEAVATINSNMRTRQTSK